jgi:hypothetical protein
VVVRVEPGDDALGIAVVFTAYKFTNTASEFV